MAYKGGSHITARGAAAAAKAAAKNKAARLGTAAKGTSYNPYSSRNTSASRQVKPKPLTGKKGAVSGTTVDLRGTKHDPRNRPHTATVTPGGVISGHGKPKVPAPPNNQPKYTGMVYVQDPGGRNAAYRRAMMPNTQLDHAPANREVAAARNKVMRGEALNAHDNYVLKQQEYKTVTGLDPRTGQGTWTGQSPDARPTGADQQRIGQERTNITPYVGPDGRVHWYDQDRGSFVSGMGGNTTANAWDPAQITQHPDNPNAVPSPGQHGETRAAIDRWLRARNEGAPQQGGGTTPQPQTPDSPTNMPPINAPGDQNPSGAANPSDFQRPNQLGLQSGTQNARQGAQLDKQEMLLRGATDRNGNPVDRDLFNRSREAMNFISQMPMTDSIKTPEQQAAMYEARLQQAMERFGMTEEEVMYSNYIRYNGQNSLLARGSASGWNPRGVDMRPVNGTPESMSTQPQQLQTQVQQLTSIVQAIMPLLQSLGMGGNLGGFQQQSYPGVSLGGYNSVSGYTPPATQNPVQNYWQDPSALANYAYWSAMGYRPDTGYTSNYVQSQPQIQSSFLNTASGGNPFSFWR